MKFLFRWCEVRVHCKLSNQRNVQNLDVRHEPIKAFVSGLSLQFLPTPTPPSPPLAKKGLILRLAVHFSVNPIQIFSIDQRINDFFPLCPPSCTVIPLYTQYTFDVSCWSPDKIMRLSLHSCTSYLDARFSSVASESIFSSISVLF